MSGIKTDMMRHWFLYEKDLSSLLTCQQVTVGGGEHQSTSLAYSKDRKCKEVATLNIQCEIWCPAAGFCNP